MNNKLLSDYCGVCWHEHPIKSVFFSRECTKCGETFYADGLPDFSTPKGYELLHKSISKNRDWSKLYYYLKRVGGSSSFFLATISFHERPCNKKAQIISDWLEGAL